MTDSNTPTTNDQPLYILVNFAIDKPEQDRIRAVDPRITLDMTQRPEQETGKPTNWASPTTNWVRLSDEELAPLVERANVLFTFRFPLDMLDQAKNLKWVQLSSAGADHMISLGLFDKRPDLTVTTVSGIHEVPISEHVLGAMLAFSRGFPTAWKAQQDHKWDRYLPQELAGKTVGVFGYGPIAKRIARLAKAFDMRVLVTRRTPTAPDDTVDQYFADDGLRDMLPQCDYFVLAAPLTNDTRHVIGAGELKLLKKEAVLVNISRGALIDEKAMIAALQQNQFAGAALDVFETEPLPADSPLWSLTNVMITPHNSGASPLYNQRATELFCDNLRAYLDGKELRNVVDPQRGY